MAISRSTILFVEVVLLAWSMSAAVVQQEVRVTVGGSAGTPGTSIVVPIYFKAGVGREVGQLRVEINYVSANLKFLNLESGIMAQMGSVDLNSEVEEGENDKGIETQTVIITGSVQSPTPQAKGIASGLLAYLNMQISENGRAASISLRASATANELETGKPIPSVSVSDATVEVQAPGTEPVVSCFFFSH